jgi:hypothetical protein
VALCANTIPKSGTHLLERIVCRIPGHFRRLERTVHEGNLGKRRALPRGWRRLPPGRAVFAHLPWTAERMHGLRQAGVRTVFLVRDPRDVAVSMVDYALARPRHWLHRPLVAIDDPRERLRLVVRGDEALGLDGVVARYERFAGWLDGADLVLRFEDLVGPHGGGSVMAREQAVRSLLARLDVAADPSLVADLAEGSWYEDSPTFYRPAAGRWREHFDAPLLRWFAAVAADRLGGYGYPLSC